MKGRHPLTYCMWVLATLFAAMLAYSHQFAPLVGLVSINVVAYAVRDFFDRRRDLRQ